MHTSITQNELKNLFSYDPETGIFIRLVTTSPNAQMGNEAGCIVKSRNTFYKKIVINGPVYFAHRLAWLYMTGSFPQKELDHIDGDGLNNKFNNLREATRSQNGANSGTRKNNKLGVKGVYHDKINGGYVAQIGFKNQLFYLGYFKNLEAAKKAYDEAAVKFFAEFAKL